MIGNFKLKVFRIVAEMLNYRRAADELHLTQPAVTAQIRPLEESLGIALFDRRLSPAKDSGSMVRLSGTSRQ